ARCPGCGFSSPDRDYSGAPDTERGTLTVRDREGAREFALPGDSVFNIYNTLTVIAALRELGLSRDEAAAALEGAEIPASRYNETEAGGVRIVMQMAKDRNALACSRAFDYVAGKPGRKQLILMMNNLSDAKGWSENTCWLYDCDFELLNREDITRIVATGPRAPDYYLRLLLAGVPEDKLRRAARETDAPAELTPEPGGSVYIFYGTDAIDLAYRVRDLVKRRALHED
ncbi:MAG: DUF1727 domain-containing protein, partial [Oscillospiraceae bacterium]|nr:DUF1727 domain-containing protein [Oscillospiraceae bacterium]